MMKTIFEKSTREELIGRIRSLNEKNNPLWGKMNLFQMMKHCTGWDDLTNGKIQVKPMFMGKIFGRWALRTVLKDDRFLRKNTPTVPALKIREQTGDTELQKAAWIERIREYEFFSQTNFKHPFFGSMTRDQVGKFVYKHHDHHLRQFGA